MVGPAAIVLVFPLAILRVVGAPFAAAVARKPIAAPIVSENARAILRAAEDRQRLAWPDEAALRAADGSIVSDFASELDDLERRVFALTGDGMRHRAIAARLGIPVNHARRAYRSYERKRQRFQLLYDAGRAGTESHPRVARRPRDSEQPA